MPEMTVADGSRTLYLPDMLALRAFAKALAHAIRQVHPGALLLFGDLGTGKTTLTTYLVRELPGGAEAETSSPSFTICNIYSTQPLVHHFDLYRLEPCIRDEALDESLDNGAVLTIIEWPDRLAPGDMPDDGLICRLSAKSIEPGRMVELHALGPKGTKYMRALLADDHYKHGCS